MNEGFFSRSECMERRARMRNEAEENNFAGNEQSEIDSKIVNASVETNEHRFNRIHYAGDEGDRRFGK